MSGSDHPSRYTKSPADPSRLAYGAEFAGAPVAAHAGVEQALAGMLEQPPAWARLDEAKVDRELLRRVPVGPTLLLGIGGSALGARAALQLAEAGGLQPSPWRIVDTVDPIVVADALEWASALNAKLMVVSKSGTTVEVLALLEAALARGLAVGSTIADPLATTGETAIRRRIAAAGGSPCELDIPPEVGGRWSVLTAVGQAPLRAANLDPYALLDGARSELGRLHESPDARAPLARSLAWRIAHPAAHSVLWCYSEVLGAWAAWLQQLECESLGRTRGDGSRTGELVCILRGPADQHSVAQLLLEGPTHARVSIVDFDDEPSGREFAPDLVELARLRMIEREACFVSMTLPTRRVLVRDRGLDTLGALFLHGMLETALVATVMEISPYGQPAVESIKRAIRARQ